MQLKTKKATLNRVACELAGTKLEPFFGKIPQILSFTYENGNDNMKQVIEANYRQIKADVVQIVENEMDRIKVDPDLQHLIQEG